MRAVNRRPLPQHLADGLRAKQEKLTTLGGHPGRKWDSVRKTKLLAGIERTLKSMMGDRQRCMYCVDSHGSDIEHFWPKAHYPERVFVWENLLLCCTKCGRLKGDSFPLEKGLPLIVDPSSEDPWDFLDFDPETGIISAKWESALDTFSPKGNKTEEILRLSRREELSSGYRKTWRSLCLTVSRFLTKELPPEEFLPALISADEHGLLGWCLDGAGANEAPFRDWRNQHPESWAECVAKVHAL